MSYQDDAWFVELLKPLRQQPLKNEHPSRSILRAYIQGRLPDLWRTARPLPPNTWTLTEVSQHLLSCRACAEHLALMRRAALERVPLWADFVRQIPSAVRTHIALYAIALVVFLGVHGLLMVIPTPVSSQPCVPAFTDSMRGGVGDFESNTFKSQDKPWSCVTVPQPSPWPQWWALWLFIFWMPLIGLHLLWSWLTATGPHARKRPA